MSLTTSVEEGKKKGFLTPYCTQTICFMLFLVFFKKKKMFTRMNSAPCIHIICNKLSVTTPLNLDKCLLIEATHF